MNGEPLDGSLSLSLGSRVSVLRPGPMISVTMARLMQNLGRGEAAESSRQHCSRVATRGPESEPSTLRKSFPRLFSVVILNMWYWSRCIGECTEGAIWCLILFTTNSFHCIYLIGFPG